MKLYHFAIVELPLSAQIFLAILLIFFTKLAVQIITSHFTQPCQN